MAAQSRKPRPKNGTKPYRERPSLSDDQVRNPEHAVDDNEWYCIVGVTPVGPMSFADLMNLLAQRPDWTILPVWRPAFTGWRRAADVPEVSAARFKPPPNRQLQIKAAPVPTQLPFGRREVGMTDAAETPQLTSSTRDDLVGIGGWLLVLSILQLLGPLLMLVELARYHPSINGSVVTQFPATFVGQVFLSATLFCIVTYTSILFFRHSKLFPLMFILECALAFLLLPLGAIWTAATLSHYTGMPFDELLIGLFGPQRFAVIGLLAISSAIWISYVLKSRRVRITFTE